MEQNIKEKNGYDYILLNIAKCINEKYQRNKQQIFNGLLLQLKDNQNKRNDGGINGFSSEYLVNALKEVKTAKAQLIKKLVGIGGLNCSVNKERTIINHLLRNSTVIKPSIYRKHLISKLALNDFATSNFKLCTKTLFYEWV